MVAAGLTAIKVLHPPLVVGTRLEGGFIVGLRRFYRS